METAMAYESITESAMSFLTPTSVLIFVLIFILAYYVLIKSTLPPGPLKVPIVGSLWWFQAQLRTKRRPPEAMLDVAKKYGDIVHFQLGKENVIIINGYDAIHDAFVKHSEHFSARPSRIMEEVRREAPGNGVIFESGKPWKNLRRFTMQALKDFGVGKTSLEEKILVEIDAATAYLNAKGTEPLVVRQLTSMMITNIIYGIVFGKRCLAVYMYPKGPEEHLRYSTTNKAGSALGRKGRNSDNNNKFDYADHAYHEIIEHLDTLFNRGSPLEITSLVPAFISKLLKNKEQEEAKKIHYMAVQWVREHSLREIEAHEATFDNNNIRDFVDLFVQAKKGDADKSLYTMDNLFYVIMDLFVAGSETTSNTLNWIVLYMQEYPDIQHKCQQEIHEKYGDRQVTWSDRGTLPYVEATLMEIQRMSNIAELSLPHTNENEVIFRGYRIPKGSLIQANLMSSNMDPKYWDDPKTFNPERFVQDGKIKKNQAFIPFSLGPRVCLGENLAKMELFLIFTNFLQRFTFHRENEGTRHTFGKIFEQLTSAPLPYKTRAVSRN